MNRNLPNQLFAAAIVIAIYLLAVWLLVSWAEERDEAVEQRGQVTLWQYQEMQRNSLNY